MVLNVAAYQFVSLSEPEALAVRLRQRCSELALRGSILLAAEGINLFLAGAAAAVEQMLDELRQLPGLQTLQAKHSYSQHVPFARMKVKVKREIIAFRQAGATPLQAPRAAAVAPQTLQRWIAQGHDDQGRRLVLLDTRNREEVARGTFEHAVALPIDNFTELPAALQARCGEWADAAVVSFCTGGIRCEKAAIWMQQNGLPDVMQLEGGILNYFEQVGAAGYQGDCFVFDQRQAVRPDLSPCVDAAAL